MALSAYLKLVAKKQGPIKGGVTQKGREGLIEVHAVDHQVNRSFDAESGVPAAARQHQPLVITKEVDISSPILANVMASGDTLSTFSLMFWQPTQLGQAGGAGTEIQYYTVTLTNAQIVGIKLEMPNNTYPELVKFDVREKIAFTYSKITWTIVNGGITGTDDWSPSVLPAP